MLNGKEDNIETFYNNEENNNIFQLNCLRKFSSNNDNTFLNSRKPSVSSFYPCNNLFDLNSNSINSVKGLIQPQERADDFPLIRKDSNNQIYNILQENIKKSLKKEKQINDEKTRYSSTIQSSNNNLKSKIVNGKDSNYFDKHISQFYTPESKKAENFPNGQYKTDIKSELQNQLMQRNIVASKKLRKIQFFEKLERIGKNGMINFEKEFRNEFKYVKENNSNDYLIYEKNIDNNCPLTLIFYCIFNPKTIIYPNKKSFFVSILEKRGEKDIKLNYSLDDLSEIPKYFKDFNFVNNLFNNFDENELGLFLESIETWKKNFSFELRYIHCFKRKSRNEDYKSEIIEKANIKLISPYDLIVIYITYFKNKVITIYQYHFHCDINFDEEQGRFLFKTTAKISKKYENKNILELLSQKMDNLIDYKENLLLQSFLSVIKEESQKNKIISDNIFQEHLQKYFKKYYKNNSYIKEKYKNCSFEEEEEKIYGKQKVEKKNKMDFKGPNQNNNNLNHMEINFDKKTLLFYGVILTFLLFIFKTLINIEKDYFSSDILFDSILILIIGYTLYKNTKIENK